MLAGIFFSLTYFFFRQAKSGIQLDKETALESAKLIRKVRFPSSTPPLMPA